MQRKTTMVVFAFAVSLFMLNSKTTLAAITISGKGLKVGLNLANYYSDGFFAEYSDHKIGFAGGGFILFGFGENLIIQPELLFTMKGARLDLAIRDETGSEINAHDNHHLNYLELPVLTKLIISTKGNARPNVFIGPYFAFKLSANRKSNIDDFEDDLNVNQTDYGIIMGAGVDFYKNNRGFMVDIRWTLGLQESWGDYQNGAISLLLGYSF